MKSDTVSTVSPSSSQQILQPVFGGVFLEQIWGVGAAEEIKKMQVLCLKYFDCDPKTTKLNETMSHHKGTVPKGLCTLFTNLP